MGIFGVILGLAALLCALLATFLFGTVGGVIAGVLAAAAILLGFLKRKKDKKGGIVAIVVGAIAVLITFAMTSVWSTFFSELHKKALELKPDGLWAQVSEETNGGMMGIIKNMPKDEATMNALMDEMSELNKLSENK